MLRLWYLHRRPVLIIAGSFVGLLAFMGAAAVVLRISSGTTDSGHTDAAAVHVQPHQRTSQPTAPATDVASWDAISPVVPAVSIAYPAIPASASSDPDAFIRAFVTTLFTRDYERSTRAELVAWSQYESAPLRSPNYPQRDWTKVLVDSLTDLTWDDATDTPIPAEGPWLALHAERARQSATGIKVRLDPTWEDAIAKGYEPPDPLATVRDVSLSVTQMVGNQRSQFTVALAVQLGTSPRGGYGVAATNNYVVKGSK